MMNTIEGPVDPFDWDLISLSWQPLVSTRISSKQNIYVLLFKNAIEIVYLEKGLIILSGNHTYKESMACTSLTNTFSSHALNTI